MELGMIGLGRMGAGLAKRLGASGHRVVAYDRDTNARESAKSAGATVTRSLEDLTSKLAAPRIVWVMVPAGDATEETVSSLATLLDAGDLVVDGGNSNYRDTIRLARTLGEAGIDMLDCGTSGGVWGVTEGYCLMVGGPAGAVGRARPLFEALAPAPDRGWAHVGPSGAGHFVKMVHNGIEYGMMQALAEGFAILEKKEEFDLDLANVAEIWRHGSVVRSWLLDLTARALEENPELDGIAPRVSDSGEGRWTVAEAIDLDVPAPVITHALLARLRSRADDSFGDKLLAALRNQFGGHAVKRAEP